MPGAVLMPIIRICLGHLQHNMHTLVSVPVSHGWIPHVSNERDDPLELLNFLFREIYNVPLLVLQSERSSPHYDEF